MDNLKSVNLVEKYIRLPLILLHICGLWRRERNPIIYFIYSVILLFSTQYLYVSFQIIYVVNVWGDIEKIAEASFLLLTETTLCVKIIVFIAKKDKAIQLTKAMNCDAFAPSRSAHLPILNTIASVQAAEYYLFLFMSAFAICLFAILPLIDAAPGDKFHPFKAWYPIPADVTPYYELLYLYQIWGICCSAMINVSIDRLSTSMTALGCAQLEILKDNLINIEVYAQEDLRIIKKVRSKQKGKSLVDGKLSFAREMNLYENNVFSQRKPDIDDLIQTGLVKCILHHQRIVKFIQEMEECFHWGILAQFAASVVIICITGLQITLVNPSSNKLKFATKILYMIAMLAQIFFICRVGNDISVISGQVKDAAYQSPWIERKKTFNTSLLIFMERLKKPIVTRAGHFFPLSFHTYVSILRSSYSYFALLQQLNKKK